MPTSRWRSVRRVKRSRHAMLLGMLVVTVPALGSPAALSQAARARSHPAPREGGCPIFPASNPLNQDISHTPVDPHSAAYIASIGLGGHLHPDFGTEPSYGIPYAIVGPHQPK